MAPDGYATRPDRQRQMGTQHRRTLLGFDDVSLVLVGQNEPLRRNLDGILIATPSATHAELALPYIEAGISTFIEKPMTTSVIEAQHICEAPDAAWLVYADSYHAAWRAVLDGASVPSCEQTWPSKQYASLR